MEHSKGYLEVLGEYKEKIARTALILKMQSSLLSLL